jgi:hypothetical protein
MQSHSLLRTNVGLTSNVKILVGNTYSLYLDSIDSNSDLMDTKYKKLQFNKDNYWDDLIPYFYQDTPADTAFYIKYDNDNDKMATDFSQQYDDLYISGARDIVDNKYYEEDYEYFAPLYISKGRLPKYFVIFRIDGPGLTQITKDNFNSELLNNLKFVKLFDMTTKSDLGLWLDNNINKNNLFPNHPFYLDYRPMEFSSWFGINYESGGYCEKAFMLDSTLEYENTFHELEKFIFDGYKNNKIIFPHILNFSFLFDDNPATPTSLRTWSINRYLGFYLDDLEFVKYISPYILPGVRNDVIIDSHNILYSSSGLSPFVDSYTPNEYPYIEIGGEFYRIEKYLDNTSSFVSRVQTSPTTYVDQVVDGTVTKYKIVANISLAGRQSEINKNVIYIDSSSGSNIITFSGGATFSIDGFDTADVWLLKIGDIYHNISIDINGNYILQTDYAFQQSVNKFDYYINDPDPNYRKSIDLTNVDIQNPPVKFGLYRCNFTSISDFDTDILDTQFSKHEYIKNTQLTLTDEPKMFVTNHLSPSIPKDLHDYKINNTVVNIPTSSEYTANSETFRIVDNDLSTLWRKNSIRLKWGYQNSKSASDYPYLLNNSFSAEDYNRTTDVHNVIPTRHHRNLDYFMSINSDDTSYSYHSLHIEDIQNGQINTDFKFELDKYLGLSYSSDYFSEFFGKKSYRDSLSIVDTTEKWSHFNAGDSVNPNTTLYRGIKFKMFDVSKIQIDNGLIQKINTTVSNKYDDYKFAILYSKNDYDVVTSPSNVNQGVMISAINTLTWKVIDNWKTDVIYQGPSGSTLGDIVIYDNILYTTLTQSQITQASGSDSSVPFNNPIFSSDWTLLNYPNIFWSASYSGINNTSESNIYSSGFSQNYPPLIYRTIGSSGEYYYSSGTYGVSSWWSWGQTYSAGDLIMGRNTDVVYQALTFSSNIDPEVNGGYRNYVSFTGATYSIQYWTQSGTSSIWNKVNLWLSNVDYGSNYTWNNSVFGTGSYVLYNDIVYATTTMPIVGVEPQSDSNWSKVYSLTQDTNYVYGTSMSSNNIIKIGSKFFMCMGNTGSSTLDNGIVIYINNIWENVLVNIYVNDNTFSKISNVNRDDLYTDLHSKLTANNFMNVINEFSNKYDFSDYIKYVIINEDGTMNIYDFNNYNSITNLPVLLTSEEPDQFLSRIESINIQAVTVPNSQLKANKVLDYGNITSLDQLNYYANEHIATQIEKITSDPKIISNFSGMENNIYNVMWRHSGPYMPILNKIPLFAPSVLSIKMGNYKFDTELTDFGTIKEKVVTKVNRNGNILKLKDNKNIRSIYPMLDEFGYHVTDYFIFKSNWDLEYHIECNINPPNVVSASNQSLAVSLPNNNTNYINLNTL